MRLTTLFLSRSRAVGIDTLAIVAVRRKCAGLVRVGIDEGQSGDGSETK